MINKALIIALFFISASTLSQEGENISIESFIYNTELLSNTEQGEIIPQFNVAFNEKIKFYIFEKFGNYIESVENIIWQSYQTKTNQILKYHFINYIVIVKIKSTNENNEFRYLELIQYPSTDRIETFYIWNPQKRDFELNKKETERLRYLPDLKDLLIQDQKERPSIDEILNEYKDIIKGIRNNLIYFNQSKQYDLKSINKSISDFVLGNYSNIDFIMNISFDSYYTFIGSYDKYHYYTFIVQMKLENYKFPFFIEVFYNAKTKRVNSDFEWDNNKKDFYRPIKSN
jgi:hypothetical protein